jgi:hypothetical protein
VEAPATVPARPDVTALLAMKPSATGTPDAVDRLLRRDVGQALVSSVAVWFAAL